MYSAATLPRSAGLFRAAPHNCHTALHTAAQRHTAPQTAENYSGLMVCFFGRSISRLVSSWRSARRSANLVCDGSIMESM